MNGLSMHLPILPVLLPLVAGIVLLALRNAPDRKSVV